MTWRVDETFAATSIGGGACDRKLGDDNIIIATGGCAIPTRINGDNIIINLHREIIIILLVIVVERMTRTPYNIIL